MSEELDALIVRSLPELNEAATRLDALSLEIGQAVDVIVAAWANDNGWKNGATWFSDGATWLALPEWMVPGDPNESAYLYFNLELSTAATEDFWWMAGFTGSGQQQVGLALRSNVAGARAFKRLWRNAKNTKGMPLKGSDFFLPLEVDRDTLASAVLAGTVTEALEPVRKALERLPQLAALLDPLRRAIIEEGKGTGAP